MRLRLLSAIAWTAALIFVGAHVLSGDVVGLALAGLGVAVTFPAAVLIHRERIRASAAVTAAAPGASAVQDTAAATR